MDRVTFAAGWDYTVAEEDDIDEEAEEGGDAEDGEGEGAPKKKGKKKLLIIVGLVLLLVFGGIAGAYFTGLLEPVISMIMGTPEPEGTTEEKSFTGGVYYELPELLVNLNTSGKKNSFLKIRISLEIDTPEDIPRIEQIMPRIVDNFQVYLRELRIEDLKGAAGMYRLREELLTRVSAAAAPIRVNDVLFREMLIQ